MEGRGCCCLSCHAGPPRPRVRHPPFAGPEAALAPAEAAAPAPHAACCCTRCAVRLPADALASMPTTASGAPAAAMPSAARQCRTRWRAEPGVASRPRPLQPPCLPSERPLTPPALPSGVTGQPQQPQSVTASAAAMTAAPLHPPVAHLRPLMLRLRRATPTWGSPGAWQGGGMLL